MKDFFYEHKITIYVVGILYFIMITRCLYTTAIADQQKYGGKFFGQIAREFKNAPLLALLRYFFLPFKTD